MTRSDDDRLRDIVGAADLVAEFIAGQEQARFVSDALRRSAVAFQLLVVGEAARRLSPDLRNRHQDLPWRVVADFRNVIAHGYFHLSWTQVWEAATSDLPPFREAVRDIIDAGGS